MTGEIDSFSTMLREALGERIAPDAVGFKDMLAADAMMEFPYAPVGMPSRLEGRQGIAEHLAILSELIAFDRIGRPTVHATGDADVVILEFDGQGRGTGSGARYHQRYVSVIHTFAGQIVRYRDYWNPLAVLRAIKGDDIADSLAIHEYAHD